MCEQGQEGCTQEGFYDIVLHINIIFWDYSSQVFFICSVKNNVTNKELEINGKGVAETIDALNHLNHLILLENTKD